MTVMTGCHVTGDSDSPGSLEPGVTSVMHRSRTDEVVRHVGQGEPGSPHSEFAGMKQRIASSVPALFHRVVHSGSQTRPASDLLVELKSEFGWLHELLHSPIREGRIRIQNRLSNLLFARSLHAAEAA